ncbi:MAG: type II toxin-antitoxin system RelE/ParE family toxin [Clostridia bacterium]|nr:type II toxin-antitoxin system RelE/ParE family toxin [Clostridia bacterium]
MTWDIKFLPEADRDLDELSHSQQVIVKKAIKKVQQNPLLANEGGYGKPLGHKRGLNLTNLLKIKLLKEGIRIVYKLIRTETKMLIVVVGVREV